MHEKDTIYVAGHRGLVGSAIVRALKTHGYDRVVTRTRSELDLTNQAAVNAWFEGQSIDCVFLAAARVGGIHANDSYRAEFIYQNLAIQTNIIHAAYQNNVRRLVFLGSSCIYPRDCPQPMREDQILTGALEQTNLPYAVAKIAGLKMVEAYNRQYGTRYLTLMPTNLYGVHDNFDLNTSHVIPAMIRKIHMARGKPTVVLWGTGCPRREFLLVDDLAQACVFAARHPHVHDILNVGSGDELTISDLAHQIADIVGFSGRIEFDPTMPDGTPRKFLDSSRINEMGWRATTDLAQGIRCTYDWFLKNRADKAA